MGRLDAKFRKGAKKVLDKIQGTAVNFTLTASSQEGDYDPTTGAVSGTPATYEIRASPLLGYNQKLVNGTTILAGDSFILVDELQLEAVAGATGLERGWKVTFGSDVWTVISVSNTKGGDLNALRKVQLRK